MSSGVHPWTAAAVLEALMYHHGGAALVPEVVIQDDYPIWAELESGHGQPHTRRIDALMFDSLQRTAIEIKVSAADVKRETWQKVRPWRRVVHRYVYVVPAGLIEQPPIYGCGLWWLHPPTPRHRYGRLEVRRKARVQPYPEQLPQHVIQALAYRAVGKSPIVAVSD